MRILLDAMCGGLRSYLRMCGHDAAYALDRGVEDDEAVIGWADEEGRTLVTRNRRLAARAEAAASGSVLLTEREVTDQLRELADAGVSLELADPPSRCGRCNGGLERVDPDRTPGYVPDDETDVWQCVDCGQCFWKGSHWEDVRDRLDRL